MPGFLGGSTGSSGTGGEIAFPKEFIDPVTKLRVSQPENLIDTDFEYGLQPTKWETVELINNTPSFFSKSGDTTIPNIISVVTNAGTREITVVTALEHGLSVGIPISVTGTKSVTADGAYIINSIPNSTTFTYLCKDNQPTTSSIEDLYTSIITGEFFQGSQLRIADAEGIVTNGQAVSTLTVTTDSTHGFGVDTPFYFLNLNSTISQEFEAANTAAKSFDASNSATAQTFDGSNTLSTVNIDWSNSATVGGVTSTIGGVNTTNNTITVAHGTETFANQPLGTPLYYNVTTSAGYFNTNPRGVVFLKTTNALNNPAGTSTFQVSATPDGDVIPIVASMTGTFQLANQARTFAGNNVNPTTQVDITIISGEAKTFDGANNRTTFAGVTQTNKSGTITGYSGGTIQFTPDSGAANLDFYVGSMVLYTTTGSAATGLTANTTYWVDDVFLATGTSYRITLRTGPGTTGTIITSISGGTGTQKLSAIGVSVDKDVMHVQNHGFAVGDMVRYQYPVNGRFNASGSGEEVNYYFVEQVYDSHNLALTHQLSQVATVAGYASAVVNDHTVNGVNYRSYTMNAVGSGTVTFSRSGFINLLVVGGGGGGGTGGGGAGGLVYIDQYAVAAGTTYSFTVGAAGAASIQTYNGASNPGGNSTFSGGGLTITATGGGPSGHSNEYNGARLNGGSGGGAGSDAQPFGVTTQAVSFGSYTNVGFGHNGGEGYNAGWTGGGGGGGAGGAGGRPLTQQANNGRGGTGGIGRQYNIRTGSLEYYAGGGAGGNNTDTSIAQVSGGLGGGGNSNTLPYTGATGVNGTGPDTTGNGLSATFYGGGGGGGDHQGSGGNGFRGVVIFRHTR